MGTVASQITSLAIVYTAVYSDADQSKHQSSASLAFVWGIHRGPVNSPHKWPVTRKMLPFDDVIMENLLLDADDPKEEDYQTDDNCYYEDQHYRQLWKTTLMGDSWNACCRLC